MEKKLCYFTDLIKEQFLLGKIIVINVEQKKIIKHHTHFFMLHDVKYCTHTYLHTYNIQGVKFDVWMEF